MRGHGSIADSEGRSGGWGVELGHSARQGRGWPASSSLTLPSCEASEPQPQTWPPRVQTHRVPVCSTLDCMSETQGGLQDHYLSTTFGPLSPGDAAPNKGRVV